MHKHIRAFTGIRAVALWGVILYHLYPHVVRGGYLGVVVFFVLSGYLLMRQFLDKPTEPIHKFIDRYKRLTPPLLFVVAVTTFFAAVFFRDDFSAVFASGLAALFGVNNWQQILHGFSYFDLHGRFLPFTHMWALSAQMQFYLVWAILQKRFGKKKPAFVLSLAVMLIVSFLLMMGMTPFHEDHTRIYYGTDTRFFSFAMGALFAVLGKQGIFRKPQRDKSLHVLALTAVTLLLFFFFAEGKFLYYGGMFLFTLLICFLLVFVAKDDNAAARAFDTPLLRYFGSRSYELYLWQYPLMLLFQQFFAHHAISYTMVVLLQLPVLLLAAEGTYRLFRAPKRKKLVPALLLVFLLSSGAGFLLPESPAAEADPVQTEEAHAEGDVPQGVSAVNAEWPALALTEADLETLAEMRGLMIGDSITEMVAPYVEDLMPRMTVNGKVNRQLVHAKDVLSEYDLENLDTDVPVVYQLGTNSDFHSDTLKDLLDRTGDRPIYLINTAMPDPWEASVNEKFAEAAKRPNVHLIDWYSIAKEREDIFIEDHTHPKGIGRNLFAQMVAKALLAGETDAE